MMHDAYIGCKEGLMDRGKDKHTEVSHNETAGFVVRTCKKLIIRYQLLTLP